VGDDKSAQYEKEVYEKVSVPDKTQGIDRAENVEMKYRDKQRGNTTPTVQYRKVHPGPFRQGRRHAVHRRAIHRHANFTSLANIPQWPNAETAQFRALNVLGQPMPRETFPACPALSRSETAAGRFANIWQERCLRRQAAYGKITSGMYG
jgi:hypothetical protein